jgi:hypothetical protein
MLAKNWGVLGPMGTPSVSWVNGMSWDLWTPTHICVHALQPHIWCCNDRSPSLGPARPHAPCAAGVLCSAVLALALLVLLLTCIALSSFCS